MINIANVDYSKLKKEYLMGNISYRELAKKHSVSFSTLRKVAAKEQWAQLREQVRTKTDTKTIDIVSDKNAKIDDTYFRCVDKLMRKAEELIETTPIWQPQMLKDLATTMKYLKECKGVKSDADMREQEARIRNLEKQAKADEGANEAYTGVVLLPPIAEPIKPPVEDADEQ